ncbi:MAG: MoaD/ThiS family protein [Candidatus Bathyarchaeia archaeon]
MKVKIFVEFAGKLVRMAKVSGFWIFSEEELTVKDLIEKIEKEKGVKIAEDPSTVILVNGCSIEKLDVKLRDLDKVVITPFSIGG